MGCPAPESRFKKVRSSLSVRVALLVRMATCRFSAKYPRLIPHFPGLQKLFTRPKFGNKIPRRPEWDVKVAIENKELPAKYRLSLNHSSIHRVIPVVFFFFGIPRRVATLPCRWHALVKERSTTSRVQHNTRAVADWGTCE